MPEDPFFFTATGVRVGDELTATVTKTGDGDELAQPTASTGEFSPLLAIRVARYNPSPIGYASARWSLRTRARPLPPPTPAPRPHREEHTMIFTRWHPSPDVCQSERAVTEPPGGERE
jgi:hypothetical protein